MSRTSASRPAPLCSRRYTTRGPFAYADNIAITAHALTLRTPGFGRRTATRALQLYYAQLALNQLWTPLNFGLGQRFLALLDLSALTVTLGYWLTDLKDVEHRAFLLNVPYLAWSVYATALNAGFWWLNGGEDTVKSIWAKVKGGAKEIGGKKKGE